jgi:hypothetical protein
MAIRGVNFGCDVNGWRNGDITSVSNLNVVCLVLQTISIFDAVVFFGVVLMYRNVTYYGDLKRVSLLGFVTEGNMCFACDTDVGGIVDSWFDILLSDRLLL